MAVPCGCAVSMTSFSVCKFPNPPNFNMPNVMHMKGDDNELEDSDFHDCWKTYKVSTLSYFAYVLTHRSVYSRYVAFISLSATNCADIDKCAVVASRVRSSLSGISDSFPHGD